MISLACPSCKKVHYADESLLGKRVKCKDCGAAFEVMANAPQPVQQPNAGQVGQRAAAAPAAIAGATWGDFSEEPLQLSNDVPSTRAQRTFGLVWVVFYWTIEGFACLVFGCILAVMGGALGGTLEQTGDIFGPRGFRGASGTGVLVAVLLEFLGFCVFHYGLLLFVACYGLWTFRRWGLSLARGLAVASVVLSVIGFIICLVYRAGIVGSLVGVVISAGILVYLYGSANLRDRLQRYMRAGGPEGAAWNQYR